MHMKRHYRIAFISAALLLAATSAAMAQQPAWLVPFNRSRELYEQHKYEESLPFAQKALTMTEKTYGPVHREV